MPSLQDIIDANPNAETFRFGDGPALCAEILSLVRAGRKTATCEAMRVYEQDGDSFPEVGRRDIALEWTGEPAVMIETVEVKVLRWHEMTEELVEQQGEFRDLAHWQEGYKRYFARNGGWSDDMKLMCERFRVVTDYKAARGGSDVS